MAGKATSRGDELLAELPDEAVIRITVAQKKAVLGTLMQASKYSTPDELAEAIAVAVVTANDDKTRYCVLAQSVNANGVKSVFAYGPYASYASAAKVAASGHCGLGVETRVLVTPLVTAPKSTHPKPPDPTPKKASKKAPTNKRGIN